MEHTCVYLEKKGEKQKKRNELKKSGHMVARSLTGWRTFSWRKKIGEASCAHMTLHKRQLRNDMGSLMLNVGTTSAFTSLESTFMIFRLSCVSASFRSTSAKNKKPESRSPSAQHIATHSSDSWRFIALYCNCRVVAIVKAEKEKRVA